MALCLFFKLGAVPRVKLMRKEAAFDDAILNAAGFFEDACQVGVVPYPVDRALPWGNAACWSRNLVGDQAVTLGPQAPLLRALGEIHARGQVGFSDHIQRATEECVRPFHQGRAGH